MVWNILEDDRRLSKQGNELMSHRFRREASVRKQEGTREESWLPNYVMESVSKENNKDGESKR